MTRANLVPPIATASERTPQRPLSKALGKAPAVNPDRGNPRIPGKRSIGTERVQSRCRHRSCATRSPASGALGATTSPRGPRSTGVGGAPRIPRASRRRSPDRGPKASTGRLEGVSRVGTNSRCDIRRPSPKRRPADEAPVNVSPSTRGRSRRRWSARRGPRARRRPPPALAAANTLRMLQRDPAARCRTRSCDPRSASPGSENPVSPPNPSHLVRTNQRLSSVSPRTTPHDPHGSTPKGCLDAARSSCDRSRSLHDVASCETCASATVRERNAPSE